MLRALDVVRADTINGRIALDTITLDRASRWRRRVAMKTDHGHDLLLDLPEATLLANGDALILTNGMCVKVLSAAEQLLTITAGSPLELARIAWHIGNRHTPAEITADAIYIQPDHVIGWQRPGNLTPVRSRRRRVRP